MGKCSHPTLVERGTAARGTASPGLDRIRALMALRFPADDEDCPAERVRLVKATLRELSTPDLTFVHERFAAKCDKPPAGMAKDEIFRGSCVLHEVSREAIRKEAFDLLWRSMLEDQRRWNEEFARVKQQLRAERAAAAALERAKAAAPPPEPKEEMPGIASTIVSNVVFGSGMGKVMEQIVRNVLSNIGAFFDGLGDGWSDTFSSSEAEATVAAFVDNPANWFEMQGGLTKGAIEGIIRDIIGLIPDLIELIGGIPSLIKTLGDVLTILTARNGEEFARSVGYEVGTKLAKDVVATIGKGGLEVGYRIGLVLGPIIFEIVIAIVAPEIIPILVARGLVWLKRVFKVIKGLDKVADSIRATRMGTMLAKLKDKADAPDLKTRGLDNPGLPAPAPARAIVEGPPRTERMFTDKEIDDWLDSWPSEAKTVDRELKSWQKPKSRRQISERARRFAERIRALSKVPRAVIDKTKKIRGSRVSDHAAVARAWEKATEEALAGIRKKVRAQGNLPEGDVPSIAELQQAGVLDREAMLDLYEKTRGKFWDAVRADPNARQVFEGAGFEFPDSGAPLVKGWRDVPAEGKRQVHARTGPNSKE